MSALTDLALPLLQRMDPERAHRLSLRALQAGLVGGTGPIRAPRLRVNLAGMVLENPLGLAAGFDKNAEAVRPLSRLGFGFLEVGGATPQAQAGSAAPRLFRLPEDQAVINRFGFNNDGMRAITDRLAQAGGSVPVGLNLGANKDSADRAADFADVLRMAGPHLSFATVNVSSPNTENLRELQGAAALSALLDGVMAARDALPRRIPVFLKVAPDLSEAEIADIAKISLDACIDGIVATNTTVARQGLRNRHQTERGGLSGRPLFVHSTRVLARLYAETEGRVPLIGVGGIEDAGSAYAKIRAGATALQLYTALVYRGLDLIPTILTGLDQRLKTDGFETLEAAVGTDHTRWL